MTKKFEKISIIIPVYNEEKNILRILRKVESVKLPLKKEIILVDDFSKDRSREILEGLEGKYIVKYHKKNYGKGHAIRTGLKYATGDVIVIQDADLEYNPEELKFLVKPIIKGKTKVVYGSRFLKKNIPRYKIYYFGNMILSLVTSILYFRKITDMETCYKMFTRDVLSDITLKAERFDFEPEITAKILKKGYKIIELPITYKCRSFEEGKKISWKDGIKAAYYLLKYRFFD